MLARASLRPGLGCQRNIGSCSSQGRLLCAVVAPQPVSSVRARLQTQTSRWRCSSATDSSRPVPSEEPSPPSDTPEAQTALPASTSEDTAVAEKRRKGIVLLEELKELVKGSNAELKAELLQQFALLQQTESEAKRQSDDDRALVLHMYHTVSQQLDDIRAQLHKRDREDGSTAATLGQVLGVVRNNGSILGDVQAAQKRVDTRTAQAVQHAKAAAASAAAAQQQQGALAEGIKAHVTSAKDAVLASNRDTAGKVASSSKAAVEALVKAAMDHMQQEQKRAAQKKLTVQQLACLAEVYHNQGLKRGRRKRAVRVSAEAISKHGNAYDMAKYIQHVFDDAYGKYWNCVVAPKGSSDRVGSAFYFRNKQYIRLGVGEWQVELWLSDEDEQYNNYNGWHNGNRGGDSDYDDDDAVYDDDD